MAETQISWPGWTNVRQIGTGSYGTVYEIERTLFGKTEKAALKYIRIPHNDSEIAELYSEGYDEESITNTYKSHLESIISEYSLMRELNGSANVVNCDDVWYVERKDGFGWDILIKMELLTPLSKALPERIPEETAIRIGKDLCRALVLCRKYGIVHRDIKPQNIFVSKLGDYKLGDFGIAKTIEKTMSGTKIGTYKFMAPEVYNNQPYGHGADIYSLGLVLYWMLNRRRMPFMPLPPIKLNAAIDEQCKMRRLRGEPLPAPAEGSRQLKAIVLKACAYRQEDRYQTAEEMLQDLERLALREISIKEPPADELHYLPPQEQADAQAADGATDKTESIREFLAARPSPDRNDDKKAPVPESAFPSYDRIMPAVEPQWNAATNGVQKKKKTKVWIIALISVAVLIAAALAVLAIMYFTGTLAEAKQIELSESSIVMSAVGQWKDITANEKDVTWESSDPDVATVTSDGRITAVNAGNATITAKLGNAEAVCSVTVATVPPTEEEIATAKQMISTISSYKNNHPVYSYDELQRMLDRCSEEGLEQGIIEQTENATVYYINSDYTDEYNVPYKTLMVAYTNGNEDVFTEFFEYDNYSLLNTASYDNLPLFYYELSSYVHSSVFTIVSDNITYYAVSADGSFAFYCPDCVDGAQVTFFFGSSADLADDSNQARLKDTAVGDYVTFGAYEQDNNTANGKEEIEWLVLDRRGNSMLLVSRYALDCQAFYPYMSTVTWETSSIRSWLNSTFLNTAFSVSEQNMIELTSVSADRNPRYNTYAGSSTDDKVFLLSVSEVGWYFTTDSAMLCKGTPYCYAQGAYIGTDNNCWWWLRTPGDRVSSAATVSSSGGIHYSGNDVDAIAGGIRPAIWITLD